MKQLCYEFTLPNGLKRLASNPTLLDPRKLPSYIIRRPHWFTPRGLVLLFNLELDRYVLYKLSTGNTVPDEILGENISAMIREAKGKLVKVRVIDGPGRTYREPGCWLLPELAQRDQTKGGTIPMKEALENVGRSMFLYDKAKRDFATRWSTLMEEISRDYDTFVTRGRVTAVLGQNGPAQINSRTGIKNKIPKTVVLMNAKTGQTVKKKIKRPPTSPPTRRVPYGS